MDLQEKKYTGMKPIGNRCAFVGPLCPQTPSSLHESQTEEKILLSARRGVPVSHLLKWD